MKRILSWIVDGYRATAIVFFSTLILIIAIELGLGLVRSVNKNKREIRFVAQNWPTLSKAYPGYSQGEVVEIVRESIENTGFEYSPWLQFKVSARSGQYVNSDGLRRSAGKSLPKAEGFSGRRHFDVYFFGGSTMFGFGVPDAATLPSQFEGLAPRNWEVRAFNYGQPYYYSRQETMLFEQLLRNGARPDVAIFLDGLNESIEMTAAYLREPFFTSTLRRRMASPIDWPVLILDLNLVRALRTVGLAPTPESLTHRYYKLPENVPLEEIVNQTYANYRENIRFTQKLCDEYRVRCLFVWQPIPMVGYQKESDTVSDKLAQPHITKLYESIRRMSDSPRGFVDFSDALEGFPGQAFVDAYHYSEPFLTVLAKRLLACVGPPNDKSFAKTKECLRPDSELWPTQHQ